MSDGAPQERLVPPRENCPDVEDCFADATEIGHVCSYGPICGTCIVYRPASIERGLLAGTCRIRPDRETFACTAPICDAYIPRAGAPNAKGQVASVRDRVVALGTDTRTRRPRPAVEPIVRARPRPVDGPVGELEMTREELKDLIREAMDEERGGGDAPMARRWEGGSVLMKPGATDTQSKEIPIDALFHKVVMVRDRLRVLEQKINAHPKLGDAEKVEMQAYVTKCYGSLTTFNVLFREKSDQFQGEKKDEE
jgi:hypothetical protein